MLWGKGNAGKRRGGSAADGPCVQVRYYSRGAPLTWFLVCLLFLYTIHERVNLFFSLSLSQHTAAAAERRKSCSFCSVGLSLVLGIMQFFFLQVIGETLYMRGYIVPIEVTKSWSLDAAEVLGELKDIEVKALVALD